MSVDTKVCPSCNTDLTLFSAEDAIGDLDAEGLKSTILSGDNGHVSDLLKAAEDAKPIPLKEEPVVLTYDDSVECPECGKPIAPDAESCPHCGVQFEVEEVFECPMCKSLLELSVTKCPSCGTEFEPEEPTPAPEPQPQSKPEPKPEPVPEQKPARPASFVDRLKQIKDEPGPPTPAPTAQAPKKEMSFAERMKAMKEGKTIEETPATPAPEAVQAPSPAPAKETPPEKQPAPSTELANIAERLKSLQHTAPAKEAPAEQKPAPAKQAAAPAPTPAAAESQADQYKELPRYIGEVKKLLMLANEMKIDVSTSKVVINKAVSAGKNRDLENAIKLVKEGKAGIERELTGAYLSKMRTMESALGLERKAGKNVSELEALLNETKRSLEDGDLPVASESLKRLEEQMMNITPSKMSEAELDTVSRAIVTAESLHLNISEAKSFYEQAKAAAAQNDSQRSYQLTKQANDSLSKILPNYIAGEMRKAKLTLREIKMMNVDITHPVQMLKEANDHVMRGDYLTALTFIKNFKEFVQKAQQ